MQFELLGNAFWTMTAGLLLVAYYCLVFRNLVTDGFRDRVAELRTRLEDVAREGKAGSHSVAVLRLRALMDGLSEHANDITFSRLAFAWLMKGVYGFKVSGSGSVEKALARVSDARTRAMLSQLHEELQLELVMLMATGSASGWLLVALTYPVYLVTVGASQLRGFGGWARKVMHHIAGPLNAVERRVELSENPC